MKKKNKYKFVVLALTDVYKSNDGFTIEFESSRRRLTNAEILKKVTDHDSSFDMSNPNHDCWYQVYEN